MSSDFQTSFYDLRNYIMRSQLKLTVLAAAMLLSTTAMANTVNITNVSASWANGVSTGSTLPTYYNNNTLDPSSRWGGGLLSAQSGYNFDAAPNPFNALVTPGSSSSLFALGTFTHVNQSISGDSITTINLLYTANVTVGGVATPPRNFDFIFNHNETPNGSNPCANGGSNGAGVNSNGCADHVQTAFSGVSDKFFINGAEYTLNILGFGYLDINNSLVKTQDFWTAEGGNRAATLYAKIVTTADTADTGGGGLNSVPEPSSLMLMGLGLAAFLTKRRRQFS